MPEPPLAKDLLPVHTCLGFNYVETVDDGYARQGTSQSETQNV